MNLLKFLKGLKEKNLPLDLIEDGSIYHCEDTGNTYLGKEIENEDGTTNKELLRYSSSVGKTVISLVQEEEETKEVKGEIFNDYINNKAQGNYSHAEGGTPIDFPTSGVIASGYASHAEGAGTKAIGNYSHAEGERSRAYGIGSHAEGYVTKAIGEYSHTEGRAYSNSIKLTGEPNSIVYTVSESPSIYRYRLGSILKYNDTYAAIIKIDEENSQIHLTNTLSIDESFNETQVDSYLDGYALGDNSHAEGMSTTFKADSHAEGYHTSAIGLGAHSEGGESAAIGDYSHAEGEDTASYGRNSHAEGEKTIANGRSSHAEGEGTKAEKSAAHAEGYLTQALAYASHAEGEGTIAKGNMSHAEGLNTVALGNASHAEGTTEEKTLYLLGTAPTYTTQIDDTTGENVIYGIMPGMALKFINAEGENEYAIIESLDRTNFTLTLNQYYPVPTETNPTMYFTSIAYEGSHVEGSTNTAFAGSHAEGYKTVADGDTSHTEGQYTRASSAASHAEGYSTEASGYYGSHAEGYQSVANGAEGSHAEGNQTLAEGDSSHAEGVYTEALKKGSHAEGLYTIANSIYQHVEGQYNIEDSEDKYAHIVGNGDNHTERSNAHTLDWEGNAWFAGDVYVKGSGQSDTENVHKLSYDSIEQQNPDSDYKHIKFWVGTQEQLDAIEDKEDDCLYFATGGEEVSGPTIKIITLNNGNWDANSLTQTVEVAGVVADPLKQIITVSPHSSNREEYLDNGVQCILQEENALIFKADSIPALNLLVYVAIQGAGSKEAVN